MRDTLGYAVLFSIYASEGLREPNPNPNPNGSLTLTLTLPLPLTLTLPLPLTLTLALTLTLPLTLTLNPDQVRLLLGAGAPVGAEAGAQRSTPLQLAARHGQLGALQARVRVRLS